MIFFFVFVDEINGDAEKEEKVILIFTVHDSNDNFTTFKIRHCNQRKNILYTKFILIFYTLCF